MALKPEFLNVLPNLLENRFEMDGFIINMMNDKSTLIDLSFVFITTAIIIQFNSFNVIVHEIFNTKEIMI